MSTEKKGKRQKIRWKYYVAVGNAEGKIGLGVRCGGDKTKAFRKAVRNAKKSMITISRACYNDNGCIQYTGRQHTVPRPVIARHGSQRIGIDLAPRGSGIANPLARVFSPLLE